jgi:hypothetical protein
LSVVVPEGIFLWFRLPLAHGVAWTLADLSGRDRPGSEDLAVALALQRGEQLETQAAEAG